MLISPDDVEQLRGTVALVLRSHRPTRVTGIVLDLEGRPAVRSFPSTPPIASAFFYSSEFVQLEYASVVSVAVLHEQTGLPEVITIRSRQQRGQK